MAWFDPIREWLAGRPFRGPEPDDEALGPPSGDESGRDTETADRNGGA